MTPGARSPLERLILERMERLPHGRASYKQLLKELGPRAGNRREVEQTLDALSERGLLIELRGGHYVLPGRTSEFAVGRVTLHRDGYGFVVPAQPPPGMRGDIFLSGNARGAAMHGDRVLARISHIGADQRAEGEVLRVLERANPTVVGEFRVGRRECFVKPHDPRLGFVIIPEGMEGLGLQRSVDRIATPHRRYETVDDLNGLIVNVEILDYPEDPRDDSAGRVIEILGHPDDFGVDVEVMIRKHQIPHRFPAGVLEHAQSIAATIPQEEYARRRDFRDLAIVTIDGETARDFDDAVWVERLPNGNFALQVHIADVSHYVRPGSPIDLEAFRRGTSVYFPDRAVPMLPLELSTEICSLKPHVDRLVLSALLEIDSTGDVVGQEFCRGVIRSAERMTYTNVHLILEGDPGLRERYAALAPRFELMKELALVLNRKRYKRGSIDFDLPEAEIVFDDQGSMTGIARAPRTIANRLIEEFMLAANEAVAAELSARVPESIYRIHEIPDPQKVLDFDAQAQRFGYQLVPGGVPSRKYAFVNKKHDGRREQRNLVRPDPGFEIGSRAYQKLVAKIEGKPEERILSYLMLRSLKQARYSTDNKGHFALATDCYTHFTSPIRRYPDLVVHRLLGAVLDGEAPPPEPLEPVAQLCSETERRAAEAERELIEWKKIRFMIDRVGDEFNALVISTTRFGFFVELDDLYIEGLAPIDALPGERFFFEENTRLIVGERTKTRFAIGDKVRVRLDRVDAVEKKLQFSWVAPRSERPPKKPRK